jgi:hypothetical protein
MLRAPSSTARRGTTNSSAGRARGLRGRHNVDNQNIQ